MRPYLAVIDFTMISVVVPAYNEEKEITRCLTALAQQKTGREFEVVVVDNASTDATAQAAKEFLAGGRLEPPVSRPRAVK